MFYHCVTRSFLYCSIQVVHILGVPTYLLKVVLVYYNIAGSISNSTLYLLKWKDDQGKTKTLRLVDMVSAKWKTFGLLLGITSNQLDALERQHSGNSNICWTKVMARWLNGGSKDQYPPTWEGLYMLLEDAEFSQVAEDLKKAVAAAAAGKESSSSAQDVPSTNDHEDQRTKPVECELVYMYHRK